jgi:hypothetical protein
VVRAGNLDTAKVGVYTVTYSVKDAFNNQATGSRMVKVVDTQRPVVLCRFGANINSVVHELKTPFEDNDYIKVIDNYYQNLQWTRSGVININKRGVYDLTYYAVDGSGNQSLGFTLHVRIKSTKPPTIQLNGEPDVLINVFDTYHETGAIARDIDGNLLVVNITGVINTSIVGNYALTYWALDADSNSVSTGRTVRVRDTEAPKITVLGADPLYIKVGRAKPYDPGYKVTDNYYNENQLTVVVNDNSVHTDKIGQYYITYNASDPSGNVAAEKNRMVIVVDSITGLSDLIQSAGYAIYPNPANSVINIDLKQGAINQVKFIDMQGKVSILDAEYLGNYQFRFNIANLPAGFYLLQAETSDGKLINSKLSIVR